MKIIRDNLEIYSPLAIIFLLILSFLLAWFTVSEGEKILSDAKNSTIIDIQKRPVGEILKPQTR